MTIIFESHELRTRPQRERTMKMTRRQQSSNSIQMVPQDPRHSMDANHSHSPLRSATMEAREIHSDEGANLSNELNDSEESGPFANYQIVRAQKRLAQPIERLFVVILLPFLFAFLLPSIRIEPPTAPLNRAHEEHTQLADFWHTTERATGDLLLALIRFPLDRMRLESGGLLVGAFAKEINSKSDLQEEETHMLMLAPAEHRTSYVPAPSQVGGQAYHYGPASETGANAGPQDESHAQTAPDYAGGPQDEHPTGSTHIQPPQGEATVVSETGPSNSALQARSDLPAVRALNVKCEKNHMTVNIVFDRPFYGMVFSKGHYNDQKCVHLPPNSGQTSVNFDIHLGRCGMSSSDASGQLMGPGGALQQAAGSGGQQQQPNGVYIENTIIIQYDPLVQEIFDQARKLRCTWYDYYEKSVTFRPYNVDMLDAVTANFLGDNIQCWMQIQVGKGPWSSEVAGIVKIGQTMTMVLAIKDDENRFDMLVRNCVAHDGKHQPIQLVDEYGCVARPKIMGRFQKVRNFGPAATVVSYAHFQAFKFPDSMSVHFQCVIQVCRGQCPEPSCSQPAELAGPSIGSSANQNGPPDYATSGTEMIASKEPLPSTGYYSGGLGGDASAGGYSNHSHGSNVNLKLDDSQGRVQVKLDTSMMAGLNGRPPQALVAAANQRQSGAGPLPPHLLHMATSSAPEQAVASTGRNYMGASYYRPVVATSSGGQQQASAALIASASTGGAPGAGLVSRQHHQPAIHMTNSRAQQVAGSVTATAPSAASPMHQAQIVHYSPQYGTSAAARRSTAAFASRLGELPPPGSDSSDEREHDAAAAEHLHMSAPYAADYPLSLIGSPRGFKLGASTSASEQHLRFRREAHNKQTEDKPSSRREARNLKSPDSTSIQTQKTIQVVSPDDVAFSLLDPSEDPDTTIQMGARSLRKPPIGVNADSVCFSASRFLWGVLVTLAALVSSIVIVTYVILKQRSQLHQKLSSVFVAADQMSGYCGAGYESTPSPSLSDQQLIRQNILVHQQQHQQLDQRQHKINSSSVQNLCRSTHQRRQHDEMQHRDNYLSRLYSQFTPANYWR